MAGQSSQQAAIYQTIIWFLITSVAAATVQLLVAQITETLVDKPNHRLRLANLALVAASDSGSSTASSATANTITDTPFKTVTAVPRSMLVSLTDDYKKTADPVVLHVRQLRVERAGVEISLKLRPGDRVGITGASGVGKSQILRTMVGLEEIHKAKSDKRNEAAGDEVMELCGNGVSWVSMPEWRTKMCLVASDNPTMAGSPLDMFRRIQNLQYNRLPKSEQRQKPDGISITSLNDADADATDWQLPQEVLQRPWSTLSSGEAQRAHLMIALSLKPKVLLLDEIGNALDDATALRVEKTLQKCKIPLLLVTHDRAQLDRFCTHHIDLGSRT